jgi:UDPglucose 6-dehydrogenase
VNVCVQGLWHLGCVTAASLAAAGHHVIGLDLDAAVVDALRAGRAPIAEPGLDALIAEGVSAARLRFTSDPAAAATADVVWIAYDTPVDADDRADVAFVVAQVARVLPHVRAGAVVIVSSQVPVGTTAALAALRPEGDVAFAYSPENLRLGKALAVFREPDRVVVGTASEVARARITELLAPITTRIEWMSIESAEMTKHAINAFLALSVTFANELASVCERVGADAKQVERGLKTESRIGPKAYLAPGGAFAGGTLARDIEFLGAIGRSYGLELPLIASVRPSNEWHKTWALRRLERELGELAGKTIAVWGLTYKPGTDTLRRSAAIELCAELAARGATVRAWDPAVRVLPAELGAAIALAPSPEAALHGASALVVATEWPELREVALAAHLPSMARALVIDANRFLKPPAELRGMQYIAVGVPS